MNRPPDSLVVPEREGSNRAYDLVVTPEKFDYLARLANGVKAELVPFLNGSFADLRPYGARAVRGQEDRKDLPQLVGLNSAQRDINQRYLGHGKRTLQEDRHSRARDLLNNLQSTLKGDEGASDFDKSMLQNVVNSPLSMPDLVVSLYPVRFIAPERQDEMVDRLLAAMRAQSDVKKNPTGYSSFPLDSNTLKEHGLDGLGWHEIVSGRQLHPNFAGGPKPPHHNHLYEMSDGQREAYFIRAAWLERVVARASFSWLNENGLYTDDTIIDHMELDSMQLSSDVPKDDPRLHLTIIRRSKKESARARAR